MRGSAVKFREAGEDSMHYKGDGEESRELMSVCRVQWVHDGNIEINRAQGRDEDI